MWKLLLVGMSEIVYVGISLWSGILSTIQFNNQAMGGGTSLFSVWSFLLKKYSTHLENDQKVIQTNFEVSES